MELRVLLSGAAPVITAPMIFGVHPGTPFLFDVTAAGDRSMTFGAAGLPKGLTLNTQTGMITGSLAQDATYDLTVSATNPFGSAVQNFRIVVGDKIELTPAMGWNSWTVYQGTCDAGGYRGAGGGDGLQRIDQLWLDGHQRGCGLGGWAHGDRFADPGKREFSGYSIAVGVHSFTAVEVWLVYHAPHALWLHEPEAIGLSSGINTWPDAQQFAAWGVDFLKYDGDPPTEQDIMYMSQALRASGRDIALSISVASGLKG